MLEMLVSLFHSGWIWLLSGLLLLAGGFVTMAYALKSSQQALLHVKNWVYEYGRGGIWLLLTLVLAVAVGWLHLHQLGILLWSLLKLTAGAYLGYWIDRTIFYYARPGDIRTPVHDQHAALVLAATMLRRAVIMGTAILALGLGV
jgi:hypothetical protein